MSPKKQTSDAPDRAVAEGTCVDPPAQDEAVPKSDEDAPACATLLVARTQIIEVQLPRIDEYVEDLIDPELGLEPARSVTRAAAKKMLDGFNGTLRELAILNKRREPQDR